MCEWEKEWGKRVSSNGKIWIFKRFDLGLEQILSHRVRESVSKREKVSRARTYHPLEKFRKCCDSLQQWLSCVFSLTPNATSCVCVCARYFGMFTLLDIIRILIASHKFRVLFEFWTSATFPNTKWQKCFDTFACVSCHRWQFHLQCVFFSAVTSSLLFLSCSNHSHLNVFLVCKNRIYFVCVSHSNLVGISPFSRQKYI